MFVPKVADRSDQNDCQSLRRLEQGKYGCLWMLPSDFFEDSLKFT